jgi:hypothetical protein
MSRQDHGARIALGTPGVAARRSAPATVEGPRGSLRRAGVVTAAAFMTVATTVVAAHGADRAACVRSYEQAQVLRRQGRLVACRGELLACMRDECPHVLHGDCSRWLLEVDRATPSVVLAARDGEGRDLTDVRVHIDGQLVATRLDGRAVALDPGERRIRFETAGGVEQTESVVVREGEKDRIVQVQLGGRVAGGARAGAGGVPAHVVVLGVVGLVAAGSFAALGMWGRAGALELEQCKYHCSSDDVDAVRARLLAADVALGVSVVSLGLATWMFVTREPSTPAQASGARVGFSLGPGCTGMAVLAAPF